MKNTLTTNQAADKIAAVYDGTVFSLAGAYALAEYLEEYEESIGEEIELDPIACACDFSERPSLVDWAEGHFTNWAEEFGLSYEDDETGEERIQVVTDEDGDYLDEVLDSISEYIQERGTLIKFDGGIIVSSF